MTRRAYVTPGNLTAAGARVGLIVAALFLIFGVVFGFVVLQDAGSSEPDMQVLIGLFFLIFVVVCAAMIVLYARVAFGGANAERNSLIDVTYDDPKPGPAGKKSPPPDADC